VKVRNDEGVAIRIGPEPCVAVRKDVDDLQTYKARYMIRKRLEGSTGLAQQRKFRMANADEWALRTNFYGGRGNDCEPFALLHGRH
jgi:hypothetical protein